MNNVLTKQHKHATAFVHMHTRQNIFYCFVDFIKVLCSSGLPSLLDTDVHLRAYLRVRGPKTSLSLSLKVSNSSNGPQIGILHKDSIHSVLSLRILCNPPVKQVTVTIFYTGNRPRHLYDEIVYYLSLIHI